MYFKLKTDWYTYIGQLNNEGALMGLWFENQRYFPDIKEDAKWLDTTDKAWPYVKKISEELRAYEAGELKTFSIKVSPEGTSFRQLVWQVLMTLEYGETASYGDIAKRVAKEMNRPSMSAQAIGGAIGHNPISIIIPCHRVIGRDGSLTGYAGGIDKKKKLLMHEGIILGV